MLVRFAWRRKMIRLIAERANRVCKSEASTQTNCAIALCVLHTRHFVYICLLCPLRTISANATRLRLSLLAVSCTCAGCKHCLPTIANCRKSVGVIKKDERSRLLLVRTTGLEPAPSKRKQEPESCASANSAMSALRCYFRLYEHLCQFYMPKIEHYFA